MLGKLRVLAIHLFAYCALLKTFGSGEHVPQSNSSHPFPYHVTVEVENEAGLNCSGVLIRNDLVVTAAHCVQCRHRFDFTVRAGHFEYRQNATNGSTVQESYVKSYIIKEGFDSEHPENDVALLWLDTNFTLNKFVNVIDMADFNATINSFGKTAEICGFGYQENGIRSEHLVKTELVVADDEKCDARTHRGNKLFSKFSICTTSLSNGTESCRGDSGSPLVFEKDGKPLLLGFSSWGPYDYTEKCQQSGGFSFTGIAYYRKWIQKWMRYNHWQKFEDAN